MASFVHRNERRYKDRGIIDFLLGLFVQIYDRTIVLESEDYEAPNPQ